MLGRALPEKKSVKYSMTVPDGVSANRLNIMEDGQVLIEPKSFRRLVVETWRQR